MDAYVIVIDALETEKRLNRTQVQQMVGRGSRSFGISQGYVFLLEDPLYEGQTVVQKLAFRELEEETDDRKAILKDIYHALGSSISDQKKNKL